MKLYQYDDLKKTNQALGSFKRNGIAVLEVNNLLVEGKVLFFVLTDSNDKPETEKAVKDENGKKEKTRKDKKAKDSKGEATVGKGEAPADETVTSDEAKPAESK